MISCDSLWVGLSSFVQPEVYEDGESTARTCLTRPAYRVSLRSSRLCGDWSVL